MARSVKREIVVSLLATVALATIAAFYLPGAIAPFRALEYALDDRLTALLGGSQPRHPRIVVIAADRDTLARLPYRLPVDRALLAKAIARIATAKPRAIGVALTFTDPTEPAKDARLRSVLRRAGGTLVVAAPGTDAPLSEAQRKFAREFTAGLVTGVATLGVEPADGAVRWIHPGETAGGAWWPGFAAQIVKQLGRQPPKYPIRLAYRGAAADGARPFLTVPLHAVADLPARWFTDKIVLFGLDAPPLDTHRVPPATTGSDGAGRLSALTIQAHATAQLFDERRVALPTEIAALIAIFLFAGAAAALASLRRTGGPEVGLFVAALLALSGADIAFAQLTGIAVPLLAPIFAYIVSYGLAKGATWQLGRRMQQHLRDYFSERTTPAMLRQIVADAGQLGLDGAERQVTVLASNIAGFSKLSDGLGAAETITLLNGYFQGMCAAVIAHEGVIDRIDAGSLVAVFGAPFDQPDHASHAVRCALAMDQFAENYREGRTTDAGALGATRIGVHSGRATFGNIGGEALFAYGAVGEAARVGRRLERANKTTGTRICISPATARAAADITVRPIGSARWEEDGAAMDIFEPLHDAASETPELEAYIRAYRLLIQDDPEAAAEIARALQVAPHDPLPRLYQSRLSRGLTGTEIALSG